MQDEAWIALFRFNLPSNFPLQLYIGRGGVVWLDQEVQETFDRDFLV